MLVFLIVVLLLFALFHQSPFSTCSLVFRRLRLALILDICLLVTHSPSGRHYLPPDISSLPPVDRFPEIIRVPLYAEACFRRTPRRERLFFFFCLQTPSSCPFAKSMRALPPRFCLFFLRVQSFPDEPPLLLSPGHPLPPVFPMEKCLSFWSRVVFFSPQAFFYRRRGHCSYAS